MKVWMWVLAVLALLWLWPKFKAAAKNASGTNAAALNTGPSTAVPMTVNGETKYANLTAGQLEAAYNAGAITYVDYIQGLEALGID